MKTAYTLTRLTCVILISIAISSVTAQRAFLFGPDAIVDINDTVVVHLDDYTGNIQWQRSFDIYLWENLEGQTSDTLFFKADTTSYIRAKVTAGDCDPFYSDTTYIVVYQTTDQVLNVDKQELTVISDSAQIASGQYVFLENISNIEVGSILVSNSGMGFMRKVTGIQRQRDVTILDTEQAYLTEVVSNLTLKDSLIITMSNNRSVFINGKEVPMHITYLMPGAEILSDRSGFNLNGLNFTYQVTQGGVLKKITATIESGQLDFEPTLHRELEIRRIIGIPTGRINKFSLIAGGDIDFDCDIVVEADIEVEEFERKRTFLKGFIGPLMLGPVPLFIDYQLELVFKGGINATGEMSFGFESDFSATFGASYNRNANPKWNNVFNIANNFNSTPFDFTLTSNAFAKLEAEPKLHLTIAGIAGPHLSVIPYLRGDLSVSWPYNWGFDLTTGIDADIGFEVSILEVELINYYTTLPGPVWNIYSTGGQYPYTDPAVTTSSITSITQNSATGGGNVTNDGGIAVTSKGVVWSTSQNPTLQNHTGMTNDGSGTGSFTSQLTGLSANTTYYVCAYATNDYFTGYGSQVSFTTDVAPSVPTVTTASISDITQNSARSGGNVTNDGGSTVNDRGICYSTSPNPTISNNIVPAGGGTGPFTADMTNLTPNTKYYVRAYATNSTGTGYGTQRDFTTHSSSFVCGSSTISDFDGNSYSTVLIGIQCWMKENLKTTKYRNGTSIQYPGSNNTNWQNNTAGAYAWYNNDINNKNLYGALYNWYAVSSSNGLCPADWRVATDSDWTQLTNYLVNNFGYINTENVGNKLKSCRQVGSPIGGSCNTSVHPRWNYNANHYGTDDFDLSAFPGGFRLNDGSYNGLGSMGYWWTNTSQSSSHAYYRIIFNDEGVVNKYSVLKNFGFSVRCIKN